MASSIRGHGRLVQSNIASMHQLQKDRGTEPSGEADEQVACRLQSCSPWTVRLGVHRRLECSAEPVHYERDEALSVTQ